MTKDQTAPAAGELCFIRKYTCAWRRVQNVSSGVQCTGMYWIRQWEHVYRGIYIQLSLNPQCDRKCNIYGTKCIILHTYSYGMHLYERYRARYTINIEGRGWTMIAPNFCMGCWITRQDSLVILWEFVLSHVVDNCQSRIIIFMVHVRLRQKYYTPQIWPYWDLNQSPPDHEHSIPLRFWS